MGRRLYPLCLVLFLSACGGKGDGPATPDEPQPLTVGTWNIQYDNTTVEDAVWENRKDITAKLLERCDFDVLGAQEPYRYQVEDLEAMLPGYGRVGTDISGGTTAAKRHYNPIFYRKERLDLLDNGSFWYSETPDVANSKGWDAYSVRMCNWAKFRDRRTGAVFFHFNSHFDHVGTEARLQSARLLVEKVKEIAGTLPAFCTADYNADQTSDPYRAIVTSGILKDSHDVAAFCKNDGWPTYNNYTYITKPSSSSRIDHIFVTAGVQVRTWTIVNTAFYQKYPSDHFPISLTLSFEQ